MDKKQREETERHVDQIHVDYAMTHEFCCKCVAGKTCKGCLIESLKRHVKRLEDQIGTMQSENFNANTSLISECIGGYPKEGLRTWQEKDENIQKQMINTIVGKPPEYSKERGEWGWLVNEPCRYCRHVGKVYFRITDSVVNQNDNQVCRCDSCGHDWIADSPLA